MKKIGSPAFWVNLVKFSILAATLAAVLLVTRENGIERLKEGFQGPLITRGPKTIKVVDPDELTGLERVRWVAREKMQGVIGPRRPDPAALAEIPVVQLD